MAVTRRFDLDRSFEKRVLGGEGVRAHLEHKVEEVAEVARGLAPDDPSTGPPDLHTSIAGRVDKTDQGYRGEVRASDWKAHLWEFGHQGRAKPFLRPAIEQVVGPLEA